jgi:hypothetical protein
MEHANVGTTIQCREDMVEAHGKVVQLKLNGAQGDLNIDSAEGIESALKRKFNNMQVSG